tara:strand:- start:52 stop:606 length:555 start_codon:yes stop_codon:yes gene_type:complete
MALLTNKALISGVLAMSFVVAISNIAVGYPINDWLTWGALTYPIAFLVTDLMNRFFGASSARKVVYGGFLVGIILSFSLASPRIAIGSGTAFLLAQLLDVFIFDRLSQKIWWKAPLISSTISSAADTALFFSIAFGGSGLPWITWAAGDYMIKIIMALFLLIPFRIFISLVLHQIPVNSKNTLS